MDEKIPCRTPAIDRDGVTNIPKWKFEALEAAILGVLNEGDCPFADLKEEVRMRMDGDDLERLGSLGWHLTTVKLEMEVRGDIKRLVGVSPQMLTLG